MDFWKPIISRIVGGLVAAGAGYLSLHMGVTLDQDTQVAITAGIVTGAYGVAHKVLDKKLNPADTAAPAHKVLP